MAFIIFLNSIVLNITILTNSVHLRHHQHGCDLPNTMCLCILPGCDLSVLPYITWHSILPGCDLSVLPDITWHSILPGCDLSVLPDITWHSILPGCDLPVLPDIIWHSILPGCDLSVLPDITWHSILHGCDLSVLPDITWDSILPGCDLSVLPDITWHSILPGCDLSVLPGSYIGSPADLMIENRDSPGYKVALSNEVHSRSDWEWSDSQYTITEQSIYHPDHLYGILLCGKFEIVQMYWLKTKGLIMKSVYLTNRIN